MGILVKKHLNGDCILGIWDIEEDFDALFSMVNLTPVETETLNGFQSYQRKLEWLSVRVLINNVLDKDCRIVYNEDRKPFLADCSHNISISHSKNLTSVLVSKSKRVGIDLEYMSHQIHNIRHKFINENEYISDDPQKERTHLYIHWCAKEALYKICDKQDINFKQNLIIDRFEVGNDGSLRGLVNNKFGQEYFNLNYFLIDGYVVALCFK